MNKKHDNMLTTSEPQLRDYNKTYEKLNEVSSSFCTAKWLQVTLHLQNGHNHSCHHPKSHQIPLGELKQSSSALHNTKYKIEQRKKMLNGQRPSECHYCWNMEDLGQFSDRTYKSSDHWSYDLIEKLGRGEELENINPRYMEVSFGNACNFKCSYCSPEFSSSLLKEYKEFGAYPVKFPVHELELLKKENRYPYAVNDKNPYVDAFWDYFPKIASDLKVFRITGGEPLINPNTFRFLNYLMENSQPQLDLAINSNLGIKEETFEKFLHAIDDVVNEKRVKSFSLYCSVDTYGAQAEYIRDGLNYKDFFRRLDTYLNRSKQKATLMVTFNIMSIPNFKRMLQDVLNLKETYGDLLDLDINYLEHPTHLSASILDEELMGYMEEAKDFLYENLRDEESGFKDHEKKKFDRIYYWLRACLKDRDEVFLMRRRADFYRFIVEYDRRKKKNFLQVFPEMKNFFFKCSESAGAFPRREYRL